MDFVRHGFQEVAQERSGNGCGGLGMQFDIGKLACPVDGHEQVKLAFRRLNFGNVDMEVADRVGFELHPCRLVTINLRQAADVMALRAAHVLAYLASDEARYVTGQCFVADGGTSAHLPGYRRLARFFGGA